MGSLKFLAQSGAHLVTWFETVGWKGWIQGKSQPSCPAEFRANANDTFVIYEALKEVSGFYEVIHSKSSDPLQYDGLVVKSKSETKFFLFNFSDEELEIKIDPVIQVREIKSLLYDTSPDYSEEKLKLRAWELVIIRC